MLDQMWKTPRSEVVYDLESDGLLDTMTKIHSLVLMDVETGTMLSCADQPGYTSIEDGVRILNQAKLRIGHSVVGFDERAIRKVFPWWAPDGVSRVRDTVLCSRLIWTDIEVDDYAVMRKGTQLPGELIGTHKLAAWGYRMGILKGKFSETTDWKEWSKEMQEYCEQDVRVTAALWQRIKDKKYSERAIQLEHDFAVIIEDMTEYGIGFNTAAAADLYAKLQPERAELIEKLRAQFPPGHRRDEDPGLLRVLGVSPAL